MTLAYAGASQCSQKEVTWVLAPLRFALLCKRDPSTQQASYSLFS